MGLLDEAIREHLELKRRHGAGEDEVRRQEHEALGPPRREVAEQAEPEPDAIAATDDGVLAPDAVEEPEPVAEGEPLPAQEHVADPGETTEMDAGEEPPPSEDVLEETPEFLQETPEHDRLWFEQKPPRDFDFDED